MLFDKVANCMRLKILSDFDDVIDCLLIRFYNFIPFSKFLSPSIFSNQLLNSPFLSIISSKFNNQIMSEKLKPKNPPLYKYGSLFVLVLQTTACVLVLRYSKKYTESSGNYISSTAIFISELCKLISCLIFIYFQQDSLKSFHSLLLNEIFRKPRETFKLIIPAGLYTIQNNLLFLALTNLDAATYQVTYQLKILTTAFFSCNAS